MNSVRIHNFSGDSHSTDYIGSCKSNYHAILRILMLDVSSDIKQIKVSELSRRKLDYP